MINHNNRKRADKLTPSELKAKQAARAKFNRENGLVATNNGKFYKKNQEGPK